MLRKIKNYLHLIEAFIANKRYGSPAKKIFTIGVTGTDGKTTTCSLIFHILKTAGMNPAMITTIGAQIGNREYNTGFHTTTPSAFFLQKYVKYAVDAKSRFLVLEVTSHALDQNRVKGIDFGIGVLTNISHEHFDYHKTYEAYLKAKTKLFKLSKIIVLNKQDKSFSEISSACNNQEIVSYSLSNNSTYNPKNINFKLPKTYDFNLENFLAAISVAKILKIPDQKIQEAIYTFKFPSGRQEVVYENNFKVVIDFAHTPNSFTKILPSLKTSTEKRVIHVFGAAGERDSSKRPMMGNISSKYADVIILTSEDTRSESIADINKQIESGIKRFEAYDEDLYSGEPKKHIYFKIPDRQKAINFAVKIAQTGDTVVITGKGHEQSINTGHGEITWSEHEAVETALKVRIKENSKN